MSKPKKGEFVVRCVMCGKDFRVGDKAECGGLYSGKPMCKTGDIQRELDRRLPKQREESKDSGNVILELTSLQSKSAALVDALEGWLSLDEENHQRYPGDEDVCLEVRNARAALATFKGAK